MWVRGARGFRYAGGELSIDGTDVSRPTLRTLREVVEAQTAVDAEADAEAAGCRCETFEDAEAAGRLVPLVCIMCAVPAERFDARYGWGAEVTRNRDLAGWEAGDTGAYLPEDVRGGHQGRRVALYVEAAFEGLTLADVVPAEVRREVERRAETPGMPEPSEVGACRVKVEGAFEDECEFLGRLYRVGDRRHGDDVCPAHAAARVGVPVAALPVLALDAEERTYLADLVADRACLVRFRAAEAWCEAQFEADDAREIPYAFETWAEDHHQDGADMLHTFRAWLAATGQADAAAYAWAAAPSAPAGADDREAECRQLGEDLARRYPPVYGPHAMVAAPVVVELEPGYESVVVLGAEFRVLTHGADRVRAFVPGVGSAFAGGLTGARRTAVMSTVLCAATLWPLEVVGQHPRTDVDCWQCEPGPAWGRHTARKVMVRPVGSKAQFPLCLGHFGNMVLPVAELLAANAAAGRTHAQWPPFQDNYAHPLIWDAVAAGGQLAAIAETVRDGLALVVERLAAEKAAKSAKKGAKRARAAAPIAEQAPAEAPKVTEAGPTRQVGAEVLTSKFTGTEFELTGKLGTFTGRTADAVWAQYREAHTAAREAAADLAEAEDARTLKAAEHRAVLLTEGGRSAETGPVWVSCDHGDGSAPGIVTPDGGGGRCNTRAEAWALFAWHAAGQVGTFAAWQAGEIQGEPVVPDAREQLRAGVEEWKLPVDATGRPVQVGHLAVQDFYEQTHARRVVRIYRCGTWQAEMVSEDDGSTFTESCNRLRLVTREAVAALVRVKVEAHGHEGRVIESIAGGKRGQFRVICGCKDWFEVVEPGRSRAIAWRRSEEQAREVFAEHAAAAPIEQHIDSDTEQAESDNNEEVPAVAVQTQDRAALAAEIAEALARLTADLDALVPAAVGADVPAPNQPAAGGPVAAEAPADTEPGVEWTEHADHWSGLVTLADGERLNGYRAKVGARGLLEVWHGAEVVDIAGADDWEAADEIATEHAEQRRTERQAEPMPAVTPARQHDSAAVAQSVSSVLDAAPAPAAPAAPVAQDGEPVWLLAGAKAKKRHRQGADGLGLCDFAREAGFTLVATADQVAATRECSACRKAAKGDQGGDAGGPEGGTPRTPAAPAGGAPAAPAAPSRPGAEQTAAASTTAPVPTGAAPAADTLFVAAPAAGPTVTVDGVELPAMVEHTTKNADGSTETTGGWKWLAKSWCTAPGCGWTFSDPSQPAVRLAARNHRQAAAEAEERRVTDACRPLLAGGKATGAAGIAYHWHGHMQPGKPETIAYSIGRANSGYSGAGMFSGTKAECLAWIHTEEAVRAAANVSEGHAEERAAAWAWLGEDDPQRTMPAFQPRARALPWHVRAAKAALIAAGWIDKDQHADVATGVRVAAAKGGPAGAVTVSYELAGRAAPEPGTHGVTMVANACEEIAAALRAAGWQGVSVGTGTVSAHLPAPQQPQTTARLVPRQWPTTAGTVTFPDWPDLGECVVNYVAPRFGDAAYFAQDGEGTNLPGSWETEEQAAEALAAWYGLPLPVAIVRGGGSAGCESDPAPHAPAGDAEPEDDGDQDDQAAPVEADTDPVLVFIAHRFGGRARREVLWQVTRAQAKAICSDGRSASSSYMLCWTAEAGQQGKDWEYVRDRGQQRELLAELDITPTGSAALEATGPQAVPAAEAAPKRAASSGRRVTLKDAGPIIRAYWGAQRSGQWLPVERTGTGFRVLDESGAELATPGDEAGVRFEVRRHFIAKESAPAAPAAPVTSRTEYTLPALAEGGCQPRILELGPDRWRVLCACSGIIARSHANDDDQAHPTQAAALRVARLHRQRLTGRCVWERTACNGAEPITRDDVAALRAESEWVGERMREAMAEGADFRPWLAHAERAREVLAMAQRGGGDGGNGGGGRGPDGDDQGDDHGPADGAEQDAPAAGPGNTDDDQDPGESHVDTWHPRDTLPGWLHVSEGAAGSWWAECTRHAARHTIGKAEDERDAVDLAHEHASVAHPEPGEELTGQQVERARSYGWTAAEVAILDAASRASGGEGVIEDANGFYLDDGWNQTPPNVRGDRVVALLVRGFLHMYAEQGGRRYLGLSHAGREALALWYRARRAGHVEHAPKGAEQSADPARVKAYRMLKDAPEARERRRVDRATRAQLKAADNGGQEQSGELAPELAALLADGERIDHAGARAWLVTLPGGEGYHVRMSAVGTDITFHVRERNGDGDQVGTAGWWLPALELIRQHAAAHAPAEPEAEQQPAGPAPELGWTLEHLACPVTLHQVGARWLRVECAECTDGEGLGEHADQDDAEHAARVHAWEQHEQPIRAAMREMREAEARQAVGKAFTVELLAVLAAAADTGAGSVTLDGGTYRLIPAGTSYAKADRLKGRRVRARLVELLTRSGYLYALPDGTEGPLKATEDGALAVAALAAADLPERWQAGQEPEALPLVPGGVAEAARRKEQARQAEELRQQSAETREWLRQAAERVEQEWQRERAEQARREAAKAKRRAAAEAAERGDHIELTTGTLTRPDPYVLDEWVMPVTTAGGREYTIERTGEVRGRFMVRDRAGAMVDRADSYETAKAAVRKDAADHGERPDQDTTAPAGCGLPDGYAVEEYPGLRDGFTHRITLRGHLVGLRRSAAAAAIEAWRHHNSGGTPYAQAADDGAPHAA
ncbi:hypothetical protein [Kitasatospora cineracea]|uniref:hypothetical protein n=1 Tax=Kitasatospora cineracea TaxID=88074 RepID=UPI0013C35D9B|nr:hypothetical protein [Kitasatospora cineracea]